MKRLYGLCTYQLNSFQYVKVNGEDTKKDHQGQLRRRNSPWMAVEVSTWSVKSCTFFMSAGKAKSGRFSPRCMLKGSEGTQNEASVTAQSKTRCGTGLFKTSAGMIPTPALLWCSSRAKDFQGRAAFKTIYRGQTPPELDFTPNSKTRLCRLHGRENRLKCRC